SGAGARSALTVALVASVSPRTHAARTNRIIEDGIMTDQQGSTSKLPDPVELSQTMARIAEQSQRLVVDFMQRQKANGNGNGSASGGAFRRGRRPNANGTGSPMGMGAPLNTGQAFSEMRARLMAAPGKLVRPQLSLWRDYMSLWRATARRFAGEPATPVIEP